MARLSISLLGTFAVLLDGEPVTTFESDKARALLAFLAVEADRPHRRETLAGLLWPEQDEHRARHSLSQTLFNVRQAIGDPAASPPFLLITPQTLQFNLSSDHRVDVNTFTTLLRDDPIHPPMTDLTLERLQQALALYRGNFLEGLSVGDSAAFEEWLVLNRERLHRLVEQALRRLTQDYEQLDDYEAALLYAWRWVEVAPWQEDAQCSVMRLLALTGQREAALAQYERCRRLLAEELGIEPAQETTSLYEHIRDGKLNRVIQRHEKHKPGAELPPFLIRSGPVIGPSLVVARDSELRRLGEFLTQVLTGHSQVVFVSGEAGSGKTTLVNEFARQAQRAYPDLIVAAGHGNAYTGVGDPYLPFREVMGMLTADIEAQGSAGLISADHAGRLWRLLPRVIELLVACGPDLIDTFISGDQLVNRAAVHTPALVEWRERLQTLLAHKIAFPENRLPHQHHLFEQYTHVVEGLAAQQPLLLILDDLHWADVSSISLLFHLGRRLGPSPVLIIGVYRPEEVSRGYGREPHPLTGVLNEFKHQFGDIWIDLDPAEPAAGRTFVDALLDSEPNRLDENFRRELARQTGGNPLFTIELLRYMQERGDLQQDKTGRWVEGRHLAWTSLPAQVEGVLEKRIGGLDADLGEVLKVASVEGETFTAEVIARVRDIDERKLVERLSSEVDKLHRLIRSQSSQRLATEEQQLSCYCFRHILFQAHLYRRLSQAERIYLHQAVAQTLEQLYGSHVEDVALKLARHFRLAGLTEKTIDYLHKAGEKAVESYANHEAALLFDEALTHLKTLPETLTHIQRELALQIARGNVLLAIKGFAAEEVEQVFGRARELCQRAGETPQLFQVMHGLFRYYIVRTAFQTTHELGQQIMDLTQRQPGPGLWLLAELCQGMTPFFMGEFPDAQTHFSQSLAFHDPKQQRAYAMHFGQDGVTTCMTQSALVLWHLGYPDQALKKSREAVALAQQIAHPFSLALTFSYAGWLYQLCREIESTQTQAEITMTFSAKHGFVFWLAMGMVQDGWRLTEQGDIDRGIAQIRQGLTTWQATGAELLLPYFLALLAEAYGKAGQVEMALDMLTEAATAMGRSQEGNYAAEIYRLRGELLRQQGRGNEAEEYFRQALTTARRQGSKSLELRAAMSVYRLGQEQGKLEEGRQVLNEIYNWFNEGFNTPDLQEATALLAELSIPAEPKA